MQSRLNGWIDQLDPQTLSVAKLSKYICNWWASDTSLQSSYHRILFFAITEILSRYPDQISKALIYLCNCVPLAPSIASMFLTKGDIQHLVFCCITEIFNFNWSKINPEASLYLGWGSKWPILAKWRPLQHPQVNYSWSTQYHTYITVGCSFRFVHFLWLFLIQLLHMLEGTTMFNVYVMFPFSSASSPCHVGVLWV